MKVLTLLNYLFWGVIVVLVLLLNFIKTWWMDIFISLSPYVLVFMLILIPVYLIFLKNYKLSVLIGAGGIILAISILPLWSGFFTDKLSNLQDKNLTVLSYNVSLFYTVRHYRSNYSDPLNNPKAVALSDWIENQDVDVIALQEFYSDSTTFLFNLISKMRKKGFKYNSFLSNPIKETSRKTGLIIFSKHEIVNEGTVFVSENRFNGGQFVDINFKGEPVRIFNAHLESSQLNYLPTAMKSQSVFRQFRWKVQNLNRTSEKRREQARLLVNAIDQTDLRCVLMGDFNSVPYSEIIGLFEQKLTRAKGGEGLYFTYYDNLLHVGLDYHFYSDGLKLEYFEIDKSNTRSHHKPVISAYSIN